MASTVEGREGPRSRPPLDAKASYLRVAERYEAMAREAEEGRVVRAANPRQAAATFRALATTHQSRSSMPSSRRAGTMQAFTGRFWSTSPGLTRRARFYVATYDSLHRDRAGHCGRAVAAGGNPVRG